jgi:hypothetical protein
LALKEGIDFPTESIEVPIKNMLPMREALHCVDGGCKPRASVAGRHNEAVYSARTSFSSALNPSDGQDIWLRKKSLDLERDGLAILRHSKEMISEDPLWLKM